MAQWWAAERDHMEQEAAAKASVREFYDGITRRLGHSKLGDASVFLNYGYVSLGAGDEAGHDVSPRQINPNSVRLVHELIGATQLQGRRVLDVGCGRGGASALFADQFGADVIGIDLSPEAIAFCRRRHGQPNVRFDIADAENLPIEAASIDVVTNIESSHNYPDLRGFLAEVQRVLRAGGTLLYTDFLSVQRWTEVRASLESLRFALHTERDITANVLASCDAVAARRAKAFGAKDALIDKFLAVPGSTVYEQMRTRSLEYRILRARRE